MPRTYGSTKLAVETLEAREVPAVIFAVNQAGRLLTFDSANPSVLLSGVSITGLTATTERITDIDVRAGSGVLYGRSSLDRLYTINQFTGVATAVPVTAPTAASNVGMDFDPTTDRIRVISNTGENITINPNNGALASIGQSVTYAAGDAFAGQPGRVTALGFTNSLPFALTTTAYGIDHLRNTLVVFPGPIDNGQVRTVGFLGVDVTALAGLDIVAGSTFAFATLQPAGLGYSLFYQINLSTGLASLVGPVGPFRLVSDIAIVSGSGFPGGNLFIAPTAPTNNLGGFNTTPLFPSVTQPLGPGLVSPGVGFFSPTFPSPPSILNNTTPSPSFFSPQ
jgi:hypothetical protein